MKAPVPDHVVQQLMDLTTASAEDCRRALEQRDGDVPHALQLLFVVGLLPTSVALKRLRAPVQMFADPPENGPWPSDRLKECLTVFPGADVMLRTHVKVAGERLLCVITPPQAFRYDNQRNYILDFSAKVDASAHEPYLFIRVSSYDVPTRGRGLADVDWCIPMARPNASRTEQLEMTLGFGGAWSDSKVEGVFWVDRSWASELAEVKNRMVVATDAKLGGAICLVDARGQDAIRFFLESIPA